MPGPFNYFMNKQDANFSWEVLNDTKQHTISISIESSFFRDTLSVDLDGKRILYAKVGGATYNGEFKFYINNSPYILEWKWSQTTGKPELIDLKNSKNEVIHRYGEGVSSDSQGDFGTLMFLLILGALAFITNPSHEKHKEAISGYIAQQSPIASVLGIGGVAAWATKYESYGVMSMTLDGSNTISIGSFGMVFVVGMK